MLGQNHVIDDAGPKQFPVIMVEVAVIFGLETEMDGDLVGVLVLKVADRIDVILKLLVIAAAARCWMPGKKIWSENPKTLSPAWMAFLT
jgi:hypothetical protein